MLPSSPIPQAKADMGFSGLTLRGPGLQGHIGIKGAYAEYGGLHLSLGFFGLKITGSSPLLSAWQTMEKIKRFILTVWLLGTSSLGSGAASAICLTTGLITALTGFTKAATYLTIAGSCLGLLSFILITCAVSYIFRTLH